jgi:hypothetical protein
MKNSSKIILLVALTGFIAAGNLRAQDKLDDLNVVTVALKLQLQAPGYNGKNGLTRTYAKPKAQSLNTKNLLDRLALDKQAQGFYAANTFPGGSKLAVAADHFVVVKSNNELIVDVSDIVSFKSGTNDILSGSVNASTGLASKKTTELILVALNFDDTFIVGGSDLKFSVQGLDTVSTTDSTPNSSSGKYVENTSDKINNAAGEGQSGIAPFVVTGSIKGSRKTTLTYAPPAS